MKAIGKMTKPLAKAPTFIPTDLLIQANGSRTNNTDVELRNGLTAVNMMASTAWVRNMDRANSSGVTAPSTRASLRTTI